MKTTTKIVLLEDDPIQAASIADEVLAILPGAELRYYDSEHAFFGAVASGELQRWNPQFAIIDLLIRYFSLEELEGMAESPNFKNLGDPYKAGIRCREALLKICPAAKVAIITVLNDTPEGLVIQKGDGDSEKLTSFLRQVPC